MSEHRLHLICNAHLDPVWLWEWEEGAAEAISTFRAAADLCEEFEGLIFNHSEVILYRWVEEYEPALFERIQRLVKMGKWHIMGGWYLQPDCNMPSGESFVRQALVGRQYFAENFGARPTTAINFDPFGHGAGLPQILVRSGYDSYLFCRPSQGHQPLPDNRFRWVGCDGSSVWFPQGRRQVQADVADGGSALCGSGGQASAPAGEAVRRAGHVGKSLCAQFLTVLGTACPRATI